jgi:hypothetical protein
MVRTLYTALHFSFRISESAARHDAGTRVSSRLRTGSLDRAGGMGGGGESFGWLRTQADVAVLIDVRVEARRAERHLRRLERVARWELQQELEGQALVHLRTDGREGREVSTHRSQQGRRRRRLRPAATRHQHARRAHRSGGGHCRHGERLMSSHRRRRRVVPW